jgi:sugar phosphate isomerase/epimerase
VGFTLDALGIQSYCFREYRTIPSLIGALRKVALPVVEIYPGHVDYQGDPAAADAAFAEIRRSGIEISAYGGVFLKGDEADNRKLLEMCRRNRIPYLTVVAVEPRAVPQLERLAAEYGVMYCLHNHGRDHQFCSIADVTSFLAKTSPAFGLCNDTAWFLDAKQDPVAAVDACAGRLYGMHFKDFTFDPAGKPVDVIVGSGGLDLPRLARRLKEIDFGGYLSLEYEGNPKNPMPEVLECLAAIRAALRKA